MGTRLLPNLLSCSRHADCSRARHDQRTLRSTGASPILEHASVEWCVERGKRRGRRPADARRALRSPCPKLPFRSSSALGRWPRAASLSSARHCLRRRLGNGHRAQLAHFASGSRHCVVGRGRRARTRLRASCHLTSRWRRRSMLVRERGSPHLVLPPASNETPFPQSQSREAPSSRTARCSPLKTGGRRPPGQSSGLGGG